MQVIAQRLFLLPMEKSFYEKWELTSSDSLRGFNQMTHLRVGHLIYRMGCWCN